MMVGAEQKSGCGDKTFSLCGGLPHDCTGGYLVRGSELGWR